MEVRYATEVALEKTDAKVERNTQDISEIKGGYHKMFTMFENFKDLPATMNSLDKTLVAVQGELSRMNEKNKRARRRYREAERARKGRYTWMVFGKIGGG